MSDPNSPTKLAELLTRQGASLGRVLERASRLETLTEQVRAALPAPESGHIVAVASSAEELVVTVDSAAWAARLRFDEQTLIRAAGEAVSGKRLVIRVRPSQGE